MTAQLQVRDQIIKNAQSLPALIEMAKKYDPTLADFLNGKTAFYSKSVWVVTAAPVVTYLAAKYGLGWDHDFCVQIAAILLWVAAIVMRFFTHSPITGLFIAASNSTVVDNQAPAK